MTKNSNQGGPGMSTDKMVYLIKEVLHEGGGGVGGGGGWREERKEEKWKR